MGRHPVAIFLCSFLACGLLCLGWLNIGEGGHNAYTTLEFEEQWTVKGSELEQQIKHVLNDWKKKNKDPWYQDYHYTMMTGKGDRQGSDMLTREMLQETLRLYGKFFQLEVTTSSGKKYKTTDLCARGAVPDNPAFPFKMPCKIVDPLNCFSDYLQFLDPLYVQFVDPSGAPGILPYHNRPALGNLSDAEIRATLSRGCSWFTAAATWEVRMWSGGREWNGNVLARAGALSWTVYMDGPRRIAFRMNLTNPELAHESDIAEAVRLHARAWAQTVEAFNGESTILESSNLKAGYLGDLEEALEKPEWPLIVASGILMNLFVSLSMASWTAPLASRCNLGQQGLGVVLFATLTAAGAFFLLGFRLNSAIMSGIPFLAMGLGVNDMLVLTRSFSELGVSFIRERSMSDIVGEVLAQAGVGVSLTSLCNVTAFCLASFVPVHGLSDFCLCAAIDSAMNYLAMMTLFLCCICLEAHRVKRGRADPAACTVGCHVVMQRRGEEACGPESLVEGRFVSFLGKSVAPRLASWPAGCFLLLVTCLGLGLSLVPIMNKVMGYNPSDIAPRENSNHRALHNLFRDYNFFEARLVYRGLDVAANQAEMLQLYADVTNTTETKFTMPYALPPYLTMFYSYVAPAEAALNATFFEAGALSGTPAGQLYAPYGTVKRDSFLGLYNAWKKMPLDDPAKALAPGGDVYQWADMVFANEFDYHADGRLHLSFDNFFLTNTKSDEDFVACIQRVTGIINASPLKGRAFVYADIFTYWSTFIGIDAILWAALGVTLAVMFASTLFLLQSPTSAVVVAAMSMLIVLKMYGICMTFLKFNTFVVSSILVGAGLSIEFTAHIASSFVLAKGTPEERLAHVMKETYPAIIQGSVSTLLGLGPLLFSSIPFVTYYIFLPYAIVVLVGMFDGMIVLPSLLALSTRFLDCVAASHSKEREKAVSDKENVQEPRLPTMLAGSSGVEASSKGVVCV